MSLVLTAAWQPRATVIADSLAYGHRLTTLEVVMHPRAVEHFLTHRALSRNGASRRAIPLWRQIEQVEEHDVFPAKWGLEQPGMVSGAEISPQDQVEAQRIWRAAKRQAIVHARRLGELKVHKEVASAPLHPYMERTYLVSATEWEGFFHLRLAPDAQADIREVAQCIRQAMADSEPALVGPGEWHLPYVGEVDREQCSDLDLDVRLVSAMRCARVSFGKHASTGSVLLDAPKGQSLADAGHWSALEHQATPANPFAETANFRGWQQLRTQMGA